MKSIQETIVIADRLGLEYSPTFPFLALSGMEKDAELICNGVGSPTSWTYHLTPNTIWGLDITPSSNIHDFDYTIPTHFNSEESAIRRKYLADTRFYNNMLKQIEDKGGILKWFRKRRAKTYYEILLKKGDEAFLADKCVDGKIDNSAGNYFRYIEIERKINDIYVDKGQGQNENKTNR